MYVYVFVCVQLFTGCRCEYVVCSIMLMQCKCKNVSDDPLDLLIDCFKKFGHKVRVASVIICI